MVKIAQEIPVSWGCTDEQSGDPQDLAEARILIVSATAYLRVWIGRLLEREPGIEVVDRVATAGQGVRLVQRLHPQLLVCDPETTRDPWMAHLFADDHLDAPRVIVVAPASTKSGGNFAVPVTAVVSQDLPAHELAQVLRRHAS
jgi:DNA-binding NarL/FixJ family response regulator